MYALPTWQPSCTYRWRTNYNATYRELTYGNLDANPQDIHQQAKLKADSEFSLWFWGMDWLEW